jgi:hypothetical protein
MPISLVCVFVCPMLGFFMCGLRVHATSKVSDSNLSLLFLRLSLLRANGKCAVSFKESVDLKVLSLKDSRVVQGSFSFDSFVLSNPAPYSSKNCATWMWPKRAASWRRFHHHLHKKSMLLQTQTIGRQQFTIEKPEWSITRTVQWYCATNVGTFEVDGGCNASLDNVIGSSKC